MDSGRYSAHSWKNDYLLCIRAGGKLDMGGDKKLINLLCVVLYQGLDMHGMYKEAFLC